MGCERALETILLKGGNPNSSHSDKTPITALHVAVQERHILAVQVLLKKGADVNARPDFTPLYCTRDEPIACYLIENGARVDLEIIKNGDSSQTRSIIIENRCYPCQNFHLCKKN